MLLAAGVKIQNQNFSTTATRRIRWKK